MYFTSDFDFFEKNFLLLFICIFVESEDSENEGTLGNLCRAVMRPPGHSGKAKKGHLCFDASFESGMYNLIYVELSTLFLGNTVDPHYNAASDTTLSLPPGPYS